jgi:predicted transcriptional regulator
MQQDGTDVETVKVAHVTILPTDTLLCALRVMKEHRVGLLPVMEEAGVLLGLITEAHILAVWERDPLRKVSEVMAACGPPGEEEEGLEGMEVPQDGESEAEPVYSS